MSRVASLDAQLLPAKSMIPMPECHRTFSTRLGLKEHALHRGVLLLACLVGLLQYGMVSSFGLVTGDLEAYYHLKASDGGKLYNAINIGSTALCFLSGLSYDYFGASRTIILGTFIGAAPILAQLDLSQHIAALDTVTGLQISYLLFGCALSFFCTAATFAPLEVFSMQDLGKVSALVQLATGLGVTIQTAAYSYLKANFTDIVQVYYTYAALSTLAIGGMMAFAFWENSEMLHTSKAPESSPKADGGSPGLLSLLASANFVYMTLIFFGSIGFVFSYLSVAGHINIMAGFSASRATLVFGIFGATGRLAENVALDSTRRHRFGGPLAYLVFSAFCFAAGLLCVALPSVPGTMAVHGLNILTGIGGASLMGIVPPALRLMFGSGYLGLLYGILYFVTAMAMPLWGKLLPHNPVSLDDYRNYLLAGAATSLIVALIGLVMMLRAPK